MIPVWPPKSSNPVQIVRLSIQVHVHCVSFEGWPLTLKVSWSDFSVRCPGFRFLFPHLCVGCSLGRRAFWRLWWRSRWTIGTDSWPCGPRMINVGTPLCDHSQCSSMDGLCGLLGIYFLPANCLWGQTLNGDLHGLCKVCFTGTLKNHQWHW